MRIPLDRQSTVPLYQQIEDYLRQGILSGSLAPGTRLPASRQLARDLGVNRITVENAYAGLETDGLAFSRVGSGTYVLAPEVILPLSREAGEASWPLWQQEVEAGDDIIRNAAVEELIRASRHPRPISFSGGIGDSHLFPAEDFRKVLQAVMRRDGIAGLE